MLQHTQLVQYFIFSSSSDTIKKATQPRKKVSAPEKYASEEGKDWKKCWDGVQKLDSNFDLCWIATKKFL